VPRALLDAGFASSGEIVVLQPRRLPARLGAARIAAELGEAPGDQVGYSVRFENVTSERTRVRFVTDGILHRRLLADPTLRGVSVVVLDEFHERGLGTDAALALLRRLQRAQRPELKLCVMSATLDADPVVRYLDDCPRLRSEGRRFEVTIEHAGAPDERPLDLRVAAAVRRLVHAQPDGDVLVFLPGNAEIRRCEQSLAPLAATSELLVLPLHGDLPLSAQARVVAPARQRKVILSTNVAETSVTIDGVVAVVDSGLARIAGHSPWTGLPTLTLTKISQASAIQRAGRAGRTRPGIALRLFTRADFDGRRAHDVPEIGRSDLTELLLMLQGQGVATADELDWLTPPPPAALKAAGDLLRDLGARTANGELTERGRRMLRFPIHPRLARLLCEGEARDVSEDAASVAALIGERDIRDRTTSSHVHAGAGALRSGPEGGVDLIALLELFEQAREARFSPGRLRTLGLDPRSTGVVDQVQRQLVSLMHVNGRSSSRSSLRSPSATHRREKDRALCRAVLTGFPDRVARRREAGSRTVLLAAGGTAQLAYEPDTDFVVALDAEERAAGPARQGAGAGGRGHTTSIVRLGCSLDPDWLADLEGEDLRASDTLELDPTTQRVVRRSRLTFRALVLDETVRPADPGPEASRVLVEAALARGTEALDEPGALATLTARLAILSQAEPGELGELGLAPTPAYLNDATLREILVEACQGLRSFAELQQIGLAARVEAALPPEIRARLASDAPLRVKLPGGRSVPVNYQPGQPPWIGSRLQDFFGMATGPEIARGRVPLTLHLLAPNGRAVQVTRDLDSFWRQHYPALRRELGRRYPRHAWPEDGRTAEPPPPPAPRRRA
jgi:ATP-dependent helicase HrpB